MLHNLTGLAALVAVVGLIVFAFRRASGVKRDPNNRDNWTYYGGGDSGSDSGGGHHHS
jgi:hypothetical protein